MEFKQEDVDYKYSCMPVDVREKDYIVCVALEKGDTGATDKSLFIENQMSSAPITYHRMDVLPEAKTCYYTDTVSYADRSVIKFSAKAFVDSSGYLEADDSKKAIQGYVDQMKE
ncbi:hypothetical protein OS493_030154 [Desmophyllum pertusum]|uniref:Uncharacterized protein n=1 Tax=Desmophyllum pertusum TaxID=174260 RepID=A0A9W9Z039_9CNID|nr:hypothetical protein OS493_030154 [Desmophyllum pertusum]